MDKNIRRAADEVSKNVYGEKAIQILYMASYFDPKDIDADMFLSFTGNTNKLKGAINLLIKHELVEKIESEEEKIIFVLKESVRGPIRTFLQEQGLEKDVLKQAVFLLVDVTDSNYSNHALSVMKCLAEHEELSKSSSNPPEQATTNFSEEQSEAFSSKKTSDVLNDLELLKSALRRFPDTLKILQWVFEGHFQTSERMDLVGTLIKIAKQGKLSEIQQSVDLYRTLFNGKNVLETSDGAILNLWHDYALTLSEMEEDAEALDILEDLLNNLTKIRSPCVISIENVRLSLASVLWKLGEYRKAQRHFEETLKCFHKHHNKLHPETLRTRRSIGILLYKQRKYDEALEILEDVAAKFTMNGGSCHLETLGTRVNLAVVLSHKREFERALEIYQDVYQKYNDVLGEEGYLDGLRVKFLMGDLYLLRGDPFKATEELQIAYEGYKTALGPNHPRTIMVKSALDMTPFGLLKHMKSILRYAKDGDLSEVKAAISNGADINEKDCKGRTPLHYAAKNGHIEVARHLLEKGAMHNIKDYENNTPLRLASSGEIKNLFHLVKNMFKEIKMKNHNKVLQNLTEHPKFHEVRDKDGYGLLHWAVYNGDTLVVKRLSNAGIEINTVSLKGNTPLHVACSKGYLEIAEILLLSVSGKKLKDLINVKTCSGGNTALHIAVENHDLRMVKCLLKHGAVFDAQNKAGETPLSVSSSSQSIRRLLSLIHDLFLRTEEGNSDVIAALHTLEPDEFEVVTHACNSQNHTLLQVAIVNKHTDIGRKLVKMVRNNQIEKNE